MAIRGQMKKAFVVGANTHVFWRKHGIPSTDTNNIVLLDDDGRPDWELYGENIFGNLFAKVKKIF